MHDFPNVEQILVLSSTEIPDADLATLDLTKFEDTAEAGSWFDRVHWTYDTKWNIVYMLDQCRAMGDTAQLIDTNECPWEVLPFGHRIVKSDF